MSDPPFALEFVDDEDELDLIAYFAAEEAFADRRRTAEHSRPLVLRRRPARTNLAKRT